MSHYVVGDIQGCDRAFAELLERIDFNAKRDRLWLVGDLVNRGPDSLKVLRRVIDLGDAVDCVLGNHDLHLLAVAAKARKFGREDTFDDVLEANDASALIDWLRARPLLVYDERRDSALVHAGIPPGWSVKRALKEAASIEAQLRGQDWRATVSHMYGNLPRVWSKSLSPEQRNRYTINALTRMRFCDKEGNLVMGFSGPPGTQPKRYVPWFEAPNRKSRDTHIFFGHWSALGVVERKTITALDSGCVWGRKLTAVKITKNTHRPRIRVKCKF